MTPDLTDDAARLSEPRGPLGVPIPSYEGRSLPNLAATILAAGGGGAGEDPPVVPPLDPSIDPFIRGRFEGTIVQFVIDGLGWYDFDRWTGHRPAGRGALWRRSAHPITSVFPSTTTAALLSLSTATPPGRHGLLGYRQYLPRFGMVADMLKFSPTGMEERDLLVGPDWEPGHLSGAPTLFRRGVDSAALTRDRFQGTGFSRLLYDGARFVGYATATDLAHELLQLLERHPPRFVSVYWDELDTIQHLKGPHPGLIDLEIERTAQLIEYVADHLPPGLAQRTMLLLTGDHGQVPAEPSAGIAVDAIPAVAAELARPLAGDRRAGFFSARSGRIAPLRAALLDALPDGSRVIPMTDAVDAGLFGPPPFHPEIHERLGDLLALVPSPGSLSYRLPGMGKPKRFLYGAHGGLEAAELVVPLVAGPLAAFGAASAPPDSKR
ncbi:MAG: alkaline phosphatase family protein [Thermoplasmata archaeon]|nr:alkaline phosphatase family protein [Thermoplasmata archaeon]MCI4359404.1 alkaline phosphatase family protein [Thermoplasmata archaeon]